MRPYKRLANEAWKGMRPNSAIVNPWDIPDPAERPSVGRPTGVGDLWGWEEQDPVGMPYKTGVLWVSALQVVLANEVLRMEAMLAITNHWDPLGLQDFGTPDGVTLKDWELCGIRTSRTPQGRPAGLQRHGAAALQAAGRRRLDGAGAHLGHHHLCVGMSSIYCRPDMGTSHKPGDWEEWNPMGSPYRGPRALPYKWLNNHNLREAGPPSWPPSSLCGDACELLETLFGVIL